MAKTEDQTEPKKQKSLTAKDIKRIKKENEQRAKQELADIRKAYSEAGEIVRKAICNTCKWCTNRDAQLKSFETKTSQGNEKPYLVMKYCGLAGLSMIDVAECEMYEDCGYVPTISERDD